ncbi:DLG5 [Bugula neritina]|uniref:DLG5 n=1 Tax=Bugula neritina TaxID=10212 RepID=A0A7J7K4D9_BUGNE|nr:DLG5 [Bugula neritina]
MKVQYNPKRCKHFPEQSQDVDKNSVTGSIQTIHAYLENGHSQKKPLYVVHSNGSSSDESGTDPPRKITVQRMSQEVGLRLCGGNITGVFIAEISSDSPFSNSDLRIADQLLVINGKDLKGFTAEQVATELNRPSDTISVVAQHNLNNLFSLCCFEEYSMIHAGSGDHFYVRAHFKYEAETAEELSISPGDLFRVENSLLYGQIGKWYVCKIDEKDNKIGSSGVVPSRIKMEESYSLRRSYSDVMPDEDSKSSKRNGSIGRRSFFKRRSGRHQHQRSGSKDSRELTSFSDLSASNDNVPTADDGAPLLYQRVEKIKCHYPRPVVILGPFAEALIQKLVNESFDKFKEYEEEFLNTDNTVIEDDISKGVFVDYKKVNDLFKVTRTDTLHRIAQSNRHSLLRVHPLAIDRMRRCKLYPIVIYIKHKSLKQIKEVKDPRFLPDHLSSKSAKELFEYFSKIELEFKNLFTVEVQGANMAAMHQNIKRVVDEEQEKHVWL